MPNPNDHVIEIIEEFLSLLRHGLGSVEEDEAALARILDALALAQHEIAFDFDETEHPDPPVWPYAERRKLAIERFPSYGYYNDTLPITQQIADSEPSVGDAIDDIADIAGDLAEFAWRWETTSEADALWHFQFQYQWHWGQHLRGLQRYLHALPAGW